MHELSLVLNIIEIADAEAKVHNAGKIDRIELEIGTLAGVEMDAFHFAWKAGVKGTVLAHSEKVINHIQAKARCQVCNHTFEIEEYYSPCPCCGEFRGEVFLGKELRVKSITIS